MSTVTISKKLTKGDELVIMPRREYEEVLRYRLRKDNHLSLTTFQKKQLQKARKNLAQGQYLTINELQKKLGVKN